MESYQRELAMVERRWERKERFNFILKRSIIGDIKIISCLIILTMAIPNVEFMAKVVDITALLAVILFGKWLIRRSE